MVVKMRSIAIAAAVISSFAVSENLGAAACPTNIINYQASGTFGPNPISGPDKFKLEGEPFSISVKVCSNKVPTQKGSDYAAYSPLELTGMVKSGLTEQNTPIESKNTTAILVQPATGVDTIQLSGIVVLEGAEISIHANIALPAGTLTSTNIAPFPSASIIPAKSEFTYVVTHGPWQDPGPVRKYRGGDDRRNQRDYGSSVEQNRWRDHHRQHGGMDKRRAPRTHCFVGQWNHVCHDLHEQRHPS